MAVTGNGEYGSDPGEGAREMATTAKAGSRRANCPMPTLSLSARQRRKVVTPPVHSGEWSLRWMLYPKTAMSINWKASLVPAAAVIPAPTAYTDAVAVKTLVVDLGAQGHGEPCARKVFSSLYSVHGRGESGCVWSVCGKKATQETKSFPTGFARSRNGEADRKNVSSLSSLRQIRHKAGNSP